MISVPISKSTSIVFNCMYLSIQIDSATSICISSNIVLSVCVCFIHSFCAGVNDCFILGHVSNVFSCLHTCTSATSPIMHIFETQWLPVGCKCFVINTHETPQCSLVRSCFVFPPVPIYEGLGLTFTCAHVLVRALVDWPGSQPTDDHIKCVVRALVHMLAMLLPHVCVIAERRGFRTKRTVQNKPDFNIGDHCPFETVVLGECHNAYLSTRQATMSKQLHSANSCTPKKASAATTAVLAMFLTMRSTPSSASWARAALCTACASNCQRPLGVLPFVSCFFQAYSHAICVLLRHVASFLGLNKRSSVYVPQHFVVPVTSHHMLRLAPASGGSNRFLANSTVQRPTLTSNAACWTKKRLKHGGGERTLFLSMLRQSLFERRQFPQSPTSDHKQPNGYHADSPPLQIRIIPTPENPPNLKSAPPTVRTSHPGPPLPGSLHATPTLCCASIAEASQGPGAGHPMFLRNCFIFLTKSAQSANAGTCVIWVATSAAQMSGKKCLLLYKTTRKHTHCWTHSRN